MTRTSRSSISPDARRIARAPVFAALIVSVWTAGTAASPPAPTPPEQMTALFPRIEGWTMDGEPAFYGPDDLFEYIDGAADAYLSYEFEELATASYAGPGKRSITIDVYRHRDLRSAFGIYSQERSQKGKFLAIGTEGYYETGVLNFFHGPYYVKIAGFHLDGDDERILADVARTLASGIGGDPRWPEALACFPPGGKIDRSERYFARDVMGHGFLRSAYTADYEAEGEPTRAYIFEAASEAELERMLAAYAEYAGCDGGVRAGRDSATAYLFADPLRKAEGPMTLRAAGRYAWGLFTDGGAAAGDLLTTVEKNLRERRLIE